MAAQEVKELRKKLQQAQEAGSRAAAAAADGAAATLLASSLAGVHRFIADVRTTPAPLRASLNARPPRRELACHEGTRETMPHVYRTGDWMGARRTPKFVECSSVAAC